ncbi:MAG: hypothetical protein J6Y53_05690 [Alphaproteobacteria bacterium]|nr:hypothetical protein [Alphaproteobacteria bacterium]
MEKKFNISELVCTRISHDLIGNIGAFSNAMELLDDDDNDADFVNESLAMLKNISAVLSARLKFFRMVFGIANSNLEKAELVSKTTFEYLQTLNLNSHIDLDFSPLEGKADLNRVFMLAVMVAADALVKGGKIYASAENGCIKTKAISEASLSKLKIEEMRRFINGESVDNPAQCVALAYLQELGAKVSVTYDKDFCLIVQ